MLHFRRTFLPLASLALIALAVPTARAGEKPPACEQTQAAIDLRSCGHCRELKRILSEPGLSGVSFHVTPLRLGATVHITADNDDARLLVQEFVDEVWGDGARLVDERTCEFCRARRDKLAEILVDWNSDSSGTELVLISEDRSLARWALEDARSTQGWVLSSASN